MARVLPGKLSFARSLRKHSSDAENRLWWLLRSSRLSNYKFRRQHVVGPYIADFCCIREKLIIELDGGQHAERQNYDASRTKFLESQGYRVVRFWDNQFLTNPSAALDEIDRALTLVSAGASPTPSPTFGGRGIEKGAKNR